MGPCNNLYPFTCPHFYSIHIFSPVINVTVFNADVVDPDLMPHSVASDLGLHSL